MIKNLSFLRFCKVPDGIRNAAVQRDRDHSGNFLVIFFHALLNPVQQEKPAINLDKNKKSLGQMVDDYEKEVILELLKKHKGNCLEAAKEAGIHKSNFYRKLQKYGIKPAEVE